MTSLADFWQAPTLPVVQRENWLQPLRWASFLWLLSAGCYEASDPPDAGGQREAGATRGMGAQPGMAEADVPVEQQQGAAEAPPPSEESSTPSVCPDADGDGYSDARCGGADCDDDASTRHPDADEICGNWKDDDCDPATPDRFDGDGDGVLCDVDCDDGDRSSPGRSGACGNLVFGADFENGPGGFRVEGGRTQGTLEMDGASWEHGVPNASFIAKAGQGRRAWVTSLEGHYANDERSYLVSPRLDFTALERDPVLVFSQVFDLDADDRASVSARHGDGEWTTLGEVGSGYHWFGPLSEDSWDGRSSRDGAWRNAVHRLTDMGGKSNVQLRFELHSDVAGTAEGVGVDDIRIFADLADLAIVEVERPDPVCAADADWSLDLVVANVGNAAIEAGRLIVQRAGEQLHAEDIDPLAPGDTLPLTVQVLAEALEGPQTLRLILETEDDWTEDDVQDLTLLGLPVLRGADYFEDFEAGSGDWVSYSWRTPIGDFNSWEWGEPRGALIGSAASGGHAWVTGLSGKVEDYERSFLQSPCFDLSGEDDDPWWMFSLVYSMAEGALGWVTPEYTLDGGDWWVPFDVSEGPGYWGLSDPDGQWQSTKQLLAGAAGATQVAVRFNYEWEYGEGFGVDDVQLDARIQNLAVEAIDMASSGCEGRVGGTAQVRIRNNGTEPMQGFAIVLEIEGEKQVRRSYEDTLAAEEARDYPIELGQSLATAGRHAVTARVEVADDRESDNVLTRYTFTQARVQGPGYVEDFEDSDGGWAPHGERSDWQWGAPEGAVLDRAGSGERAWVTQLSGDASGEQRSALVSPCFDFSTVKVDPVLRFLHAYDGLFTSHDLGWMEISLDAGASWQRLGRVGEGVAWYTSEGDIWDSERSEWLPDGLGVWNEEGWDEWHEAQHVLDGAAGSGDVMLRMHFVNSEALGWSSTEGHAIDAVHLLAEPQGS